MSSDIFGGALGSVFGEKPKVARFQPFKLGQEQKKSILGNIGNFDDISKLGEKYRQYMTQQQESLLPGYTDTLALGQKGAQQLLSTGEQFLSGQLPQDVQDAVQRNAAYGSMSGGFAGSGMSRALTARDFGLTSLDLMSRGAQMIGQGGNSAQQWAAMARGNILNPSSEMVSPMETANFDLQNRVLQQQSKQFAYNVAAAPDPRAAGVSNTLMGVLGSVVGGMMGGGKGGSPGGSSWAQAPSAQAQAQGYSSMPNYNVMPYQQPAMDNFGYPTPGTGNMPDWMMSAYGYG